MVQVTIKDASDKLAELVDAAIRGETVRLTKNGKEIIQLVPITPSLATPKFGSAMGLVALADDFDAPLDDFKDYLG